MSDLHNEAVLLSVVSHDRFFHERFFTFSVRLLVKSKMYVFFVCLHLHLHFVVCLNCIRLQDPDESIYQFLNSMT